MTRHIPKFNIGDTVVVHQLGTVGKITKIHQLNGNYFYEVNGSDFLVKENGIQTYSHLEEALDLQEEINIDYQFSIGDLVKVRGYSEDIFIIVGFRTEIWRYEDDGWEDIIYELMSATSKDWLEADEDEIILVVEEKEMGKKNLEIIDKGDMLDDSIYVLPSAKQYYAVVDYLLDSYVDYNLLLDLFQDEKYAEHLESIKSQLSKIIQYNKHLFDR